MGIGTLWDGMLTWALTEFFPDLTGRLGVPKAHTIGYCMVFGRPAVRYHRTVQRGPAKVNLVEAF
jgi:superfamily II helicase